MVSLCKSPVYIKSQGFYADCGHCLACRQKRRNQWALRMYHHSSTNNHKSLFITLTYNYKHLPLCGSVCPNHIHLFIKRLRQRINRGGYAFMDKNKVVSRIRVKPTSFSYYYVAEYGENGTKRPHYHVILFGLDASYRELIFHTWGKCSRPGFRCRTIYGKKAFAYTAGYTNKKLGVGYNEKFISANSRLPEFQRCSTGLGKAFIIQYAAQHGLENCLQLSVGKQRMLLPRYYRKVLGIKYEQIEKFIVRRENQMVKFMCDQHPTEKIAVYHGKHYPRIQTSIGYWLVTDLYFKYLNRYRLSCDVEMQKRADEWRHKKECFQ